MLLKPPYVMFPPPAVQKRPDARSLLTMPVMITPQKPVKPAKKATKPAVKKLAAKKDKMESTG